jgi:GxxExxY protein
MAERDFMGLIRAGREIRGSTLFSHPLPSMKTDKMLYRPQSESILGAAMTVLNSLKPGLSEKAYENAMVIELKKRGHSIEQQRRFDVFYDAQWVDTLVPDLLVDGLIVVDPKVVTDFNDTHVAQMMGYLAITGFRLALLINFKHADLRWKRVVR